mmetsp:Transcript_43309/g.139803  ORF Transcript_43309/g.139803 Transcript_43309/m.139803 type:complete len:228 (-) Transcript_43309:78-761(-)
MQARVQRQARHLVPVHDPRPRVADGRLGRGDGRQDPKGLRDRRLDQTDGRLARPLLPHHRQPRRLRVLSRNRPLVAEDALAERGFLLRRHGPKPKLGAPRVGRRARLEHKPVQRCLPRLAGRLGARSGEDPAVRHPVRHRGGRLLALQTLHRLPHLFANVALPVGLPVLRGASRRRARRPVGGGRRGDPRSARQAVHVWSGSLDHLRGDWRQHRLGVRPDRGATSHT